MCRKEKSIVSELRKEAATIEAQYEQAHLALREVSKLNQGIGKQIKLLNDNKTKLKEELKELERQRRDSLSVKANDDERIKREVSLALNMQIFVGFTLVYNYNIFKLDRR